MKLSDFDYELPQELIARYPLENRSASRLLVFKKEDSTINHSYFNKLDSLLNTGDLLVLNDSKVLPARFYGKKPTGGKVEILFERFNSHNEFFAHVKTSKKLLTGTKVFCQSNYELEVLGREDELYLLKSNKDVLKILNSIGSLPLPPYFARECEDIDTERYQTVYARNEGSVAAPTAGLHFDSKLIEKISNKNISTGFLTLHVGAGTFKPVRSENIFDHKMHSESYEISSELLDLIQSTKQVGGRVIAVGTTALRTLESVFSKNKIMPGVGTTDIFIYPGYKFKVCDGLITNFHLPKTTLLMLVSAFIGHENMQRLYKIAIDNQYRFFSYGDATLLI